MGATVYATKNRGCHAAQCCRFAVVIIAVLCFLLFVCLFVVVVVVCVCVCVCVFFLFFFCFFFLGGGGSVICSTYIYTPFFFSFS